MNILALDTTLNCCAVALVADGRVCAAAAESMQRGHAERIAPMADEVMRAAGASFAALDRIVVTTGPGSFTGVRVGLAFARGLAIALDKPCIGIATLEALALETGESGRRAAAIGAGPEIYIACYQHGAPLIAPCRRLVDEALDLLAGAAVRGPAAHLLGGEAVEAPDAVRLAARGAALDPALYPPDPLYLRAALLTSPA